MKALSSPILTLKRLQFEECIQRVSIVMKNTGFGEYKGGILEVVNDAIIIDPDLVNNSIQELIKLEFPDMKVKRVEKLKTFELPEFMGLEIPPAEYLVAPWLQEKSLTMIYAPRGIGKTFFALTLALSITCGDDFLKWHASRRRGVLYIDGEMPAATIQKRIEKLISNYSYDSDAPFRIVTKDQNSEVKFDLSDEKFQHLVEKQLGKIKLIVIDNISTLCHVKENDAESWMPIQEWALQMRARGISVLFVHHAGKGGAQRGTSKREDILDTVISLRRPPEYSPTDGAVFELHFEKSRGFTGEDVQPIQLSLNEIGDKLKWQVETVEQTSYERVINLANEGLTQTDIAKELGINKSNVSRHMKRAEQEGKLVCRKKK